MRTFIGFLLALLIAFTGGYFVCLQAPVSNEVAEEVVPPIVEAPPQEIAPPEVVDPEILTELATVTAERDRLQDALDQIESKGYRDWDSVQEAKAWVANYIKKRPDQPYVKDFRDCENFAMPMSEAALKEHRFIGLILEDKKHVGALTIVPDEVWTIVGSQIWLIDALSGFFSFWDTLD